MRKEIPFKFQNPQPGEIRVAQVGPHFFIWGILPTLRGSASFSNADSEQAHQAFEKAVDTLKKCDLSLEDVVRVTIVVDALETGDAVRAMCKFFFKKSPIPPSTMIFLSGDHLPVGAKLQMEIEAYQQERID